MNEQLVQAGKLASLGEMAANMGHEINNPVGIIVQEAQWIKALAQKGETALASNMTAIQDSLDEIQSHGKRCRSSYSSWSALLGTINPMCSQCSLMNLSEKS